MAQDGVVYHRHHAGDVRLLQHHRFGDDVAREDLGLFGDYADRFKPPCDLQDDRERLVAARLDGDREVHRLEARQDCSDEVVARPA